MKIRPYLLIMLFMLTLGSNINVKAGQQTESHASIRQAVQQFLESQNEINKHSKYTIKVGRLDSRLKLTACEQPLETYLAPGGQLRGRTSVGVRCSAPKPWAVYVSATVNLISTAYKTSRHLARGHIIQEQDIVSAEYNLSHLNHGYFTDKAALIGKQTRRRLKQNHVITPNQITEPLMVKRGEKVALITKSNNFSIRMKGEAMMNGARGDKIRVKNMSSKRIIEGTVTQNSEVTVSN